MTSTFNSVLENFHTNLWSHYVPIPKEIGNEYVEGDNRRILCSINGMEQFQCALMHKEGEFFVLVNDPLRKKLRIEEGDKVSVSIEKDTSEFGLPMPESFEMILSQDEEGNEYFRSLTMGKQRNLVYIVGKVKSVDSQIAKGLAIMHHLKEAKGELDFKRLNVVIKEYNSRKGSF